MMQKYFMLLGFFLIVLAANSSGQMKYLKSFKIGGAVPEILHLVPSNSISHISIQDSNIIIGSGNGLAKSTDGGKSWNSFRNNPAFANEGIFSIAVSKEVIWTSTGYNKDVNGGSVQTGSGYTYTVNKDSEWIHLPQTIDNRGDSILSYCYPESPCLNDSVRILPVLVPEQNVTFDIALSPGTVWIASWASGLRKSTDDGAHWQRILLPLDYMNSISPTDTLWTYADSFHTKRIFQKFDPRHNNNMLAFSVLASGPDTVWCGTAGGINRSTDGGKSWIRFNHRNQASPILGDWIIAIREQHFPDYRRIWITNWKGDDQQNEEFGVSYTDDDGRTWKSFLHGIRAYDFAFKDSITYIATDEGIYRTDNGGKSFVHFSNFVDTETKQAILSPQVYAAGVIGDDVYVGTNDGFARTTDNGLNRFGSDWKVFRTYDEVGTSNNTYAYPNPFAPQSNTFVPDAFVRIHYGKKTNISDAFSDRNVSIDIFDFGMNRVRSLIRNAKRPADMEYDELWDGRDDGGRIAANGVYFYLIKIDNEDPIWGKILILQ